MATVLQLRRGNATENNAFTGALGEVTVDTTNDTLRVHDGSTAGGFAIVNVSASQVLSNKTIGSDLLPSVDSAYDLGSPSFKWKDLHLSGNTIFLGSATISADGSAVVLPSGTKIGSTTLAALDSAGIRGLFSAAGDLTYNSATGEFSFDVESVYTQTNFDSDFNTSLDAASLNGTGLSYNAGTNTLSITDTGVVAGTYGSASQVPVFTVNAQGQLDSAGTVSVAGVSSTSWDSSTGNLIINTADGGSFYTNITLDPYSTTDLSEGTNLYYTTARADSDFDARLATKTTDALAEGSNLYYTTARADSDAKNAVSVTDAGGDGSLTYSATTGVFTYTGPSAAEVRAHFSGGTGITITDGSIATNDSQIVHDNLSGFVTDEHIAHSGVTLTAGVGLNGGGDISASRTFNIDSAELYANFAHDDFHDYVSNEHIDHSAVTLTAGRGLTGGGDITTSRTFAIDSADFLANFESIINHDNLTGFVSNEHIDHSGVTLTAGNGLTGGGDITASRTFAVGAGTGVTVNADNVAIGQDVATTADVVFGSVTTTGNIVVGGNLQVSGTTTTVNAQNLEVADNMIYMNSAESDGSPTQSVDVGWAANVNDDGSYEHVGMFRDATDNKFKVFEKYTPEPDAAVEINTGHASFSLAPFAARTLEGKYLGADSDIDAHLSGGTGITYSAGSISTNDAQIVHDNLSGFVANEHIDHSTVSITAGSGLTGGGTIAASRTLNIGQGTGITVSADAISTNDAQIVHDNLSGFVANEHIDHSTVSITAGDGLTGGGTIAATRTISVGAGTLIDVTADAINVDLSELSTSVTDGDGDYFVVVDTSNAQRKLTKGNINISGFNNDAGFTTCAGTVTSVGGTGTVNGLSLSGTVTTSGNLTLGGTLSISNADWSGTDLSVANGGTGASSFTANTVLLGNGTSAFQTVAPGTSGNVLTSNGTTWTSSAPTPGYTDGDVDTHLNTGTATSSQVLSWTGTDYDWVTPTVYASSINELSDGYAVEQSTGLGNLALSCDNGLTNNNNTGVGKDALRFNVSGTNNTALGTYAARSTTGSSNTAIGSSAMFANCTGTNNVAVGYQALDANTTGVNNVAMGSNALGANTAASSNVAIGYNALLLNTVGGKNTAVGYQALDANVSGQDNVAIGNAALGANTASLNVAVGSQALELNTTGTRNVALGFNALGDNTTGNDNVAVGYQALDANTTGQYNVAIGCNALGANTTSNGVVAIGGDAAANNTAGNALVAIGRSSLYSNTCGINNVAVGNSSLYNNSSGCNNAAVGYQASYCNTSGHYNSAFGSQTLYANTTGCTNSAFGASALTANTTGIDNTAVGYRSLRCTTTGQRNTAIGRDSLYLNTTGSYNTALGRDALLLNTTGCNNTAVGHRALGDNTCACDNVAVGYQSGEFITTGIQNTTIGTLAAASGTNNLTTGSNNTVIGYNASPSSATVSNEITLGNSGVTAFRIPGLNISAASNSVTINGWTITESGGSLYFSNGGTNYMKLDGSGNLDVLGNINSNATIT